MELQSDSDQPDGSNHSTTNSPLVATTSITGSLRDSLSGENSSPVSCQGIKSSSLFPRYHISSSEENLGGPDISHLGTRPWSPTEQDLSDILENYIQRHPDSDLSNSPNHSKIISPLIATSSSSTTGLLQDLLPSGDSPSESSQAKAHIAPQSTWLQLQLSSDDSLNKPLKPQETSLWCSAILSSSEEENLGNPVIFQSGVRKNLTSE